MCIWGRLETQGRAHAAGLGWFPGQRALGVTSMCLLTPSCRSRLALRRPEPLLIGLNEASVLIVQRVGKAPG